MKPISDLPREAALQRRFTATAPRRFWVVDVTYVRTWQGFTYVAIVTDWCELKIVGFNLSPTLRADILPLQALDMAAFIAGGDLTGLTHLATCLKGQTIFNGTGIPATPGTVRAGLYQVPRTKSALRGSESTSEQGQTKARLVSSGRENGRVVTVDGSRYGSCASSARLREANMQAKIGAR